MTDTFISLPLSALRESPFNPRTQYDEADLLELAASINAMGVMQPIVARSIANAFYDPQATVRYELVFGHRRFRASKLANREYIDAIVREMTDEQAAVAQIHENLKRKDVTALEEADSFAHLHKVHKMKVEAIMASVDKSRSYVYGRLKLASAAPEVRFAIVNQGLSAETGLDIARLPHHDLQRDMLQRVRLKHAENAAQPIVWMSVREAAAAIKRAFNTNLDAAPFDLTDESLVKLARACTNCPRRAGNDAALQGVLAASICMDEGCYEAKVAEHWRLQLVDARAAGHKVIEGEDAWHFMPYTHMTPRGHVNVKDTAYTGRAMLDGSLVDVPYSELLHTLGDAAPRLTVVNNSRSFNGEIVKLLTVEQAVAMLESLGKQAEAEKLKPRQPLPGAARAQTGGHEDDDDEQVDTRTPEQRAVTTDASWLRIRRAMLARVATMPRTVEDLRSIVLRELECSDEFDELVQELMGWSADIAAVVESDAGDLEDWYRNKIATMSADQLAQLLVMIAIDDSPGGWWRYDTPAAQRGMARRLADARRFGVDVLAIAAEVNQSDEAGSAGAHVDPERDPNTPDMFGMSAS